MTNSADNSGSRISRRIVLKGAVGISAAIGVGGLLDVGVPQRALAASDPGTATVPLPTTDRKSVV